MTEILVHVRRGRIVFEAWRQDKPEVLLGEHSLDVRESSTARMIAHCAGFAANYHVTLDAALAVELALCDVGL